MCHFRDQLDLHTRAEWNLRDAERTPGVRAALTKHFLEELRRAVGHDVLFGERWNAIDQNQQLDQPPHSIQVASRRVQGAQQVDGNAPRGFFSLLGRHACAELTTPWLAVLLRNVAGEKDVVSAANEVD